MQTTHDLTTVEVPIDSVSEHPDNARQGDVDVIEESLSVLGQYVPIVVQASTRLIIKGNHTHRAAKRAGRTSIAAILLDVDDDQAKRVMLMDNAASDRGQYDTAQLIRNLQAIQSESALGLLGTGYDEDMLMHLLSESMSPEAKAEIDRARSAGTELRNLYRTQRIDVIVAMALSTRWMLAMAIDAGAKPGTASSTINPTSISRYFNTVRGHDISFVDNEFIKYDHEQHIGGLRQIVEAQNGRKVKYATVRDVMTRQQCRDAGCEFFPLGLVLEHAAEVEQYADNVIVIPKYACLDDIPDKYMLGYSVLTSYGATPVPIAAFAGRRLHLLGGSLRLQAGYIQQMGDDIVSCDANMALKLASRGLVYVNDGGCVPITSFGLHISNAYFAAFALSMGVVMASMYHISNGLAGKIGFSFDDDGLTPLGIDDDRHAIEHVLGEDVDRTGV